MDKIWKILDNAELGNTDGTEIKERYDSRKFNGGCDYIGRYTDPNHEGGFRDISLKDEMDGDKRLGVCIGTGGRGEPEHFELPCWINPDSSIVIDFSAPPKGGPKDFVGLWDRDGIRFVKDGNKWPKVQQTREENSAKFFNMFSEVDDFLGEVSQDQFFELYQDIYLSCGQEEVFLHFMEECFGVKSDDQNPQFLATVTSLLNQLREKIVVGALNGDTEDEGKAREFFNRYDVNNNEIITCDELEALMHELGVVYDRSCLNALMKRVDTDKSKAMSFEEFLRLIRSPAE
mmetsp:Transcript_31563/g.41806  ORF Transcript_31563/g.41806 Transcript_31563/m.41806 type:complete len:289 (-) Transcript_31563:82-948(-)|eukprot:CAMPEP_0185580594 /NCGR_PEP_ID=MMETSP0434-20130131/17100_1 /TAXON_ID=626734 ORGANISM="Favella taraikaensis, Strain Fe Narragansett Bay" /NCGR_SAMPLE_ID=MMETSP0434 /ASSEMBLY_ACC=CAM_ASM_000379 /LENGTH=288 /DNA_ID=CAMNT_0028198901 /DNA_START=289 /DNA_END=1155 /DNA_ORIENTATION=-